MQVQDQDPLSSYTDTQTPSLGSNLQGGRVGKPPPPGFEPGKLMDSWNQWVDKPNNRAALMQFGIAMLQPVGMGETGLSHFGNAVGAAGQAAHHITEQEEEATKSDTEATLRTSRADAAERNAASAEQRAILSGQNTQLRGEAAQQSQLTRLLQAQVAARGKYDNYVKQTNADNLIAPQNEQSKVMPFEEWIRSAQGVSANAGEGVPTATPGATTGRPGEISAQAVIGHPQMQAVLQNVRAAVASGDPNAKARAKQYLDTKVAPYMNPAEKQQLYGMLGVQ